MENEALVEDALLEEVSASMPEVYVSDMSHAKLESQQPAHGRLLRTVEQVINALVVLCLIAIAVFIGMWMAFYFYLKTTNPLPVQQDVIPTPVHSTH